MEAVENNDIRSFNVGASDYATHKYQSWDFWIRFRLNSFDADLSKRTLRIKDGDGRALDYKKIKHICGERLRQLDTPEGDQLPAPFLDFEDPIGELAVMLNDYTQLTEIDAWIMHDIILETDRRQAYTSIIGYCDERLAQLEA